MEVLAGVVWRECRRELILIIAWKKNNTVGDNSNCRNVKSQNGNKFINGEGQDKKGDNGNKFINGEGQDKKGDNGNCRVQGDRDEKK